MRDFWTILAGIAQERQAVLSEETEPFWDVFSISMTVLGLLVSAVWMCQFGGFSALGKAPIRRHRMPAGLPMVLLGTWILMLAALSGLLRSPSDNLARSRFLYLGMAVLEIILIAVMLTLAYRLFARRLKGFGFDFRTLLKDAGWAGLNLIGIYPFILAGLWIILRIGRLVNPDFSLEVHESLQMLTDGSLTLKLLVAGFAVGVVPIFEEMLFRGFLQTQIRTLTNRPWLAVVITSVIFAILHPTTHIAALFMLSCGLGYAYERSGSLFRPILMHFLFNGISVAMTLLMPLA
ncbi:MAG TPA: type II CAAX endopeptidase family protein [Anaerohalosphaeraceae bacterium]|nr:CPBP family intramembrane metalloprotease [Phycisphaerae bacterium]HOK95321.1 type II CAAX endopeptidase family protein [Anaerohalosphaeraceae bacterium]HOL31491.1 type II CAAX endopeptidase family protein [Anaerohalosphaeraceae bacterium]HOM76162.1 type II CAAX endopeptidase family protein [Anaerohalosphaeraceae bacterium]HPC65050.1 type II CAAX endopeptidase family protein [Anaerohalosphaeraceae bacterium]